MSKVRSSRGALSYANVVSTLCLFLVLGGGMALAAGQLGKNTVGSKQLKKNAVTGAKIKANAVTGVKVQDGSLTGADLQDGSVGGAKLLDGSVGGGKLQDGSIGGSKLANNSVGGANLQDNSVSGAKVQDGSLTAADFNSSAFASIKANNVIGLGFNSNCTAATPLPSGVSTEHLGGSNSGECKVTFPSSVVNCAATASPRFRNAGLLIVEQRTAEVLQFASGPNSLEVDTYGNGSLENEPFDLVLVC